MKAISIPTNTTYVDAADERRIQLRGALIVQNRGNLPVRWVDVMPAVTGPSLLRPGRSDERIREYYAREAQAAAAVQTERVLVTKPEDRERRNAAKKRRYHMGAEAVKAENERRKAALRTPEQKKQHEYYLRCKAKKEGGR